MVYEEMLLKAMYSYLFNKGHYVRVKNTESSTKTNISRASQSALHSVVYVHFVVGDGAETLNNQTALLFQPRSASTLPARCDLTTCAFSSAQVSTFQAPAMKMFPTWKMTSKTRQAQERPFPRPSAADVTMTRASGMSDVDLWRQLFVFFK